MNPDLKLVAVNAEPSKLLAKQTDARMRHVATINRRLALQQRIRDLEISMATLAETQDAERDAGAKLSAMEAEQAAAMATAARASKPLPVFDPAHRDRLKAALETATSQAAVARIAAGTLALEHSREVAALHALEPAIREGIVEILFESVSPMVAEVAEMQTVLARKLAILRQVLNQAHETAELVKNGPMAGSTPAMIGRFAESIQAAIAPPLQAPSVADITAALKSMAERLRTDPLAELQI